MARSPFLLLGQARMNKYTAITVCVIVYFTFLLLYGIYG